MGRNREQTSPQPEERTCAICGRRIEWRRKWADDWADVKYCSDACRRRRREDTTTLEQAILDALDQRRGGATICPSEVARAQAGDDTGDGTGDDNEDDTDDDTEAWRGLMEPVREAARRLVARGEVQITQKGQVVDPSTAKGPIRLRRAPHSRRGPGVPRVP